MIHLNGELIRSFNQRLADYIMTILHSARAKFEAGVTERWIQFSPAPIAFEPHPLRFMRPVT